MSTKVFLAYDERMTQHRPVMSAESSSSSSGESDEETPFERPSRIRVIYERLRHLEASDGHPRFLPIPCIPASREAIELCHSPKHFDRMLWTASMTDTQLRAMSVPGDLYFGRHTFLAARLACGGVLECVKAVTSAPSTMGASPRPSTRAIAIVRPPGHHATRNNPMGFCYFNNVAVAAKYACYHNLAKKCFILDIDIHHGNGIQDLTYNDPQIFYLSIHRASFGKRGYQQQENWFYPGTGRPNEVGEGDGTGTNLNIAWPEGGMKDDEYAAAFTDVVIPLLMQYKPDLILIACGLDAVEGDLLGDCGVSPEMYYRMTRAVIEAVPPSTPIVAALEGGYNVDKSAECMENVALALLDDPLDVEKRQNYTSWSSASLLPQRPQAVTHEIRWMQHHHVASRSPSGDSSAPARKIPRKQRLAQKSLEKSTKALKGRGGTCLPCGCHFQCHHSECLPLKKRKLLEELLGSYDSSIEEDSSIGE